MEAGRLRWRVTIQHPTRTVSNTSGEKAVAFGTNDADVTVWAEIKPVTAREQIQATQTQGIATHVITMRYRDDVTDQCRIKFGDRIFNITGVINPEELGVSLQILATEVKSAA